MDSKQALEILIRAVILANKRGAFELNESGAINDAVNSFVKQKEEVKEEEKQEDGNKPESGTETDKSEA